MTLTNDELQILVAMRRFIDANGRDPSVKDIQETTGLPLYDVHKRLELICQKCLVESEQIEWTYTN